MSQQVARRRATDQLTPATVSFTPPKGFAAIEGRDHHVTFPVIGRTRSGANTLKALGSMGLGMCEFTQSMFKNPVYDQEHLLTEKELYNVVFVPTVSIQHHLSFNDGVDAICKKFVYERLPGDIILDCCTKVDNDALRKLHAEFLIIGHVPIETAHSEPCVFGMARTSVDRSPKGVMRFSTIGDMSPYGAIALRRL